jgi:hypothetical protein
MSAVWGGIAALPSFGLELQREMLTTKILRLSKAMRIQYTIKRQFSGVELRLYRLKCSSAIDLITRRSASRAGWMLW